MGNPPFIGAKYLSDSQREDARLIFAKIKNGGLLDYVAAWYVKALAYIQQNPSIDVAFVSTNSITQGEQVSVLWGPLLQGGVQIRFAHRTFQWSNEGKGIAQVHCVIIGFGLRVPEHCTIYDYTGDIKAENAHVIAAKRINPYLVDAPDYLLPNRRTPICPVPEIGIGNKPIDGGHYLFTDDEKAAFIQLEPKAAPLFRRWYGSVEFINNLSRWCLWLGDLKPNELRALPECMKRVEAVRKSRLASDSAPTQKLAETPTRFHVEFMPDKPFLVIPEVSSYRREFIPLGYLAPPTLASNKVRLMPDATLYHFAVLHSTMHMAWVRTVTGRLKSDYQYSVNIVFNNYPWPSPTDAQRQALEATAQAILDARTLYPGSSLADLYDPRTMPAELRKAHAANDRAVDAAYGFKGDKSDAGRVSFLFGLYGKLTSLLPAEKPKRARKKAVA